MPGIIVEKGPDKGTKIKFKVGKKLVVGREEGLPLKVNDITTSRKHFRIDIIDSKIQLVDLDSRNGTYLNGSRIEGPQVCKVGDKIRIGETLFSILPDEEFSDPLIDKQIAGYTIQNRLGKGGMGTVYKAVQVSLNRVVALKILSSHKNIKSKVSNNQLVEQFIREAQAAGALTHPNIVQIYDVGSTQFEKRELHYFSMEYCSRGSLQDILGQVGKISWQETIPIILQTAEGLAYAEKKNIVHRDIKPDNLMVNDENTLKIGDLGLARNLEEYSGEESAIFGTAHFVSPEQIQGKAVDHRADLYSLGATIFRLVTGETLFSGKVAKEIVMKQLSEAPRNPRDIDPSIPESFSQIVLKLLEKDSEKRYSSASALIEDLEKVEQAPQIRLSSMTHGAFKHRTLPFIIMGSLFFILILFFTVRFFSKEPENPIDHNKIMNSQQEEIERLKRKAKAQKSLSEKLVLGESILNSNPISLGALEDLLKDYEDFEKKYGEFADLDEKATEQQNYLKNEIAKQQFSQVRLFCQQNEKPIQTKIEEIQKFLKLYENNPIPPHPDFEVSPLEQAKILAKDLKEAQLKRQEEEEKVKRLEGIFKEIQMQFEQKIEEKDFVGIESYLSQKKREFKVLTHRIDPLITNVQRILESEFLKIKGQADQFAQQQKYKKAIETIQSPLFMSRPVYQKRILALVAEYRQQEALHFQAIAAQLREVDEEHFTRLKTEVQGLLRFDTYEEAYKIVKAEKHKYETADILQQRNEFAHHTMLLDLFKKQLFNAIRKSKSFSNPTIYLKGIFNFPRKTRFNIVGLDDENRVLLQQAKRAGKVTLPTKWQTLSNKDITLFLYTPPKKDKPRRHRFKMNLEAHLSFVAFLYETQQFSKLTKEISTFEKNHSDSRIKYYKEKGEAEFQKLVEMEEKAARTLIEEIEDLQIIRKNKEAKELIEQLKEKYSHTKAYKEFVK